MNKSGVHSVYTYGIVSMYLENTTLSERSQTRKTTHIMIYLYEVYRIASPWR